MVQTTSLLQLTQGYMVLNRLQRYYPEVMDNMNLRKHAKLSALILQGGPATTDFDLAEFMFQVILGWV